ncbi:PREDICTED: G-type lectin S-receptor-like serine/threonine-protein kinase SD1-1 [Nelumbo nucifera]|uniref:non-specific serine/threonine protein kinase n=2 Tax=Nelumbo nucifera TaxID=4432 RepID=A0A822ZGX9_NELNU|nr:PREDICTED: G-type lectin S-receptor-like serine/threonine-protein kinase SD1-1 [Nelumbo nucifera]DAD42921.1 TPA_asm: hypothetical protein HUJ06_001151 [Nelumbo nucifera]
MNSCDSILLLLFYFTIVSSVQIFNCDPAETCDTPAGFNCSSNSTCQALVGYAPPVETTLSSIQSLFGVSQFESLLGANSLPLSTPFNQRVTAKQTIKIPFPCACINGSGISNRVPIYPIKIADTFFLLGTKIYGGLVTYQQIMAFNRGIIPTNISLGTTVWIPLPCSCDDVDGMQVVHYGNVVTSNSSIWQIAQEFGTTPATLTRLNGISDPDHILAGQVLDVPLRVCRSNVRNDSSDYPLVVANGTYTFTANNCVRCRCDSSYNFTLQCEPSDVVVQGSYRCPPLQCKDANASNLYLGNFTTTYHNKGNVTTHTNSICERTLCAYAGYDNNSNTIFTTLVKDDFCNVEAPASRPNMPDENHSKKKRVILISIGVLLPILILLSGMTFYKRKTKKKSGKYGNTKNNVESSNEDLELPSFDLTIIADATNNFSSANKIGEGGFGPVYKGELVEGQEIAVKRLSKNSGQGLIEFKNEVILIVKLQHRNLVRLLGCCIQGEEKMLIYEFMPNKSLDYFIFDDKRSKSLNWEMRFNIIGGIARGILYLHQDSRLRIVHRDIKASNVLLDNEMNPKISDFGMARTFRGNQTQDNTNRVVGTYGYMPPEYVIDGLFSMKSDVFSYGVLVLEIVSGMKNRGFYHPEHHLNFIGHAWRLWNEGDPLELIDASLRDSCTLSEVLRCIHVGLLCVQQNPEDRPTMSSVILMLGSETASLPQPKQPGFFTERNPVKDECLSSKQECSTTNEITVTLLDGR